VTFQKNPLTPYEGNEYRSGILKTHVSPKRPNLPDYRASVSLHSFLNSFNQNVFKHTPLGVNVHVFSDNDDPAEHHIAQPQTSISMLDSSA